MKPDASILLIPFRLRFAKVSQVGPFHWALLEALRTFAPSTRPALHALTDRLHLGDRSFLEEAWNDLRQRHAVDAPDFLHARLSMEGAEALRLGHFVSAPEEHTRTLAFTTLGQPLESAPAHAPPHAPMLSHPPAWADSLSLSLLRHALLHQGHENLLPPDRRLLSFRAHWSKAHVIPG